MFEKEDSWTFMLDWLNILRMLGLEAIDQILEEKKEKAIKRITKEYTNEVLLELEPTELDQLIANELSELMKKELYQKKKELERRQNKFKDKKVIPLKRGGIIRIDPSDLKDFDGDIEKFMKNIYKKLTKDDDENDDDEDTGYDEDNTGYYI